MALGGVAPSATNAGPLVRSRWCAVPDFVPCAYTVRGGSAVWKSLINAVQGLVNVAAVRDYRPKHVNYELWITAEEIGNYDPLKAVRTLGRRVSLREALRLLGGLGRDEFPPRPTKVRTSRVALRAICA